MKDYSSVMQERAILTQAWEIVKNFSQFFPATATDEDSAVLLGWLEALWNMGTTPAQQLLAHRIATGLTEYFAEK